MNFKEYQQLRQVIQSRYDADITALDRVYAIAGGDPVAASPEPDARPKRKYAKRGTKLSPEEQREKRRLYQIAWRAKRAGKPYRATKKHENTNGLSTAKFNKFLVSGPTSAGGNG